MDSRLRRHVPLVIAWFAFGAGCASSAAAQHRIILDGAFDDWQAVPGAGMPIQVTRDESRLLIRFAVSHEQILQDTARGSTAVMVVELDGDTTNGPDLMWRFGTRSGRLRRGGMWTVVDHTAIGLVSAPTVSGAEFEVGINASLARTTPRVSIIEPGIVRHDAAWPPYTPPPPLAPIPRQKQRSSDLRVLGWNVNDHLFEPARRAGYMRILRSLEPDLVVFQEVRDSSYAAVDAFVRALVPGVGPWHHARTGSEGITILSPVPIRSATALGGSAAFLLDGRARWGHDLLVIGLSPPCCNRDAERQAETEAIMAFVRTQPGDLPLLIIGDANAVGSAEQLRTLVEATGGAPLRDLVPRHTHAPQTYTWTGPGFSPGRLDFALIREPQLTAGNRFVLDTRDMPDDALADWGLERGDGRGTSDHLPLVVDLRRRER